MNAVYAQVAAAPGDPARPNEDFAGVLGNCAVLLDGSGAPGDMPTGCTHGVPWFVRQLGSRCLAMMAIRALMPLPEVLAAAVTDVAALHRHTCDLAVPGTPSAVLAMTRTGPETLDWLVLGDVTLIIEHGTRPRVLGPHGRLRDRQGTIDVITDPRMAEAAPPEYEQMLALPTGTPEHQAARIAFVRKQQPLRNRPGGYPVASTDPDAADQALAGSVPARAVRRAVMASDGVTRFTEFGLGSWELMLGILAAHGPGELFARIREAEHGDPRGRRWPRGKRHDDVSVVYQEFAEETTT